MDTPRVRKGQGDVKLSREAFSRRVREQFYDPAFDGLQPEIDRILEVAWQAYDEYRKSPRTRKAGPGFADGEQELPIEWLDTRDRILEAEPYATSHDALDRDTGLQEETRNAARALVEGVTLLRSGAFPQPDRGLADPRPK